MMDAVARTDDEDLDLEALVMGIDEDMQQHMTPPHGLSDGEGEGEDEGEGEGAGEGKKN